jgi:hypothetical protein
LDKILADSPEPPSIVLQGDHGPDAFFNPSDLDRVTSIALQERFAILNAYHLPNGGSELLYPKISPVNTFRIILKYYFAAPLDTLDDRSYLQAAGHPYDFIDVTDRSK